MMELRWLQKHVLVREPVHEGQLGSPTKEVIHVVRVLQFRDPDHPEAIGWQDVPEVVEK